MTKQLSLLIGTKVGRKLTLMRIMSTTSCKLLSILKTQTCLQVLLLIALLKYGPSLLPERLALGNQAQTIHS